jgi:hypothetical protein
VKPILPGLSIEELSEAASAALKNHLKFKMDAYENVKKLDAGEPTRRLH